MLKIAHLGYAVWDEAIDRDVFVSEEMATIHGFTKETYLSEISSLDKYIDHIHLDDQARYRAHIMDEEEVNAGVSIEYRFVTPDGDIRHLHDCNYYISVPYGEETQVIVVIQDITEHKLSQAALEESESLFRQSAEMANLGYWVWDHYKEKMVSCSKQLAQLYEMTVEETIALFSDKETEIAYIHPDDRERYEQCRLESRDRQIGMDLEFKIILPSGTVRYIYLKEDLMIGTDGKVSRSFGLEQDITKRKEAEAELARVYLEQKESEAKLKKMNQRYELAVKSSDSGIWETNLVTGERYHSPRLAEIITLDEHKDPHLDDLDSRIHWDDLDWVQDAFKKILPGQTQDLEYRIKRDDGEYIWIRNRSYIEHDVKDKPIRVAGFIEDITEHKMREIELDQARDKANAASRAKTAFLATMSHELRTPMNGVIGLAQLLDKTALDETQKKYVNDILSSGRTMVSILNDVLDVSKIEKGMLELHLTDMELEHSLKSTIATFREIAAEEGLYFEERYDIPKGLVILADETRLRQIVWNLLSNAIKFTEKGGIKLSIQASRENGDAKSNDFDISISIRDTGIGIPVNKQQTIFDDFQQADGSITREYGGTGLGLTIVTKLAELMNGSVSLNSVENEGSEFVVEFKAQVGDANMLNYGMSSNELGLQLTCKPLFILIAEDQPVNAMVAKALLKHMGHRVEVKVNGALALAAVKEGSYDLILMDNHMPKMSGIEVTRQIRLLDDPLKAGIPIIGLTADAFDETHRELKACGMNEVLTKPIEEKVLFECLSRYASILELPLKTDNPIKKGRRLEQGR